MNIEALGNQITQLAMTYGPKLIGAILVLVVGIWAIKFIVKTIDTAMQKSDVDVSLRPFLMGIVTLVLKVMLVISVLGMLGIEMTSFIAILAAAGLAVGMAPYRILQVAS